MDAAGRREVIEKLCSFEGRGPGTDAERRAAGWLVEQLRGIGRRADTEPTYVHANWPWVIAGHVALAFGGAMVSLTVAPVGFVLVLLAATSLYLDQNTRLYLLRRFFFRRASQNVVSPGRHADAPARLVLTAHYDAGRSGWIYGRRLTRLTRRTGPLRIVFWAGIVPLLAVTGVRMAGVDASWLDLVQLLPTILLLVAFTLLVDIALSDTVPGACVNASGVAAVLAVAAALEEDAPENLDVSVVLPGGGESLGEGMRAWARRHRKRLDLERTFLVNLDSVSWGTPHFEVSEGPIVSYPTDQRLAELCHAVATARHEGKKEPPDRFIRNPLLTDALPARMAGLRAISILGAEDGHRPPPFDHTHDDTPERLDEDALTETVEFTLDLVRALDRDAGRDSSAAPEPAHQV